jgi:hypothetical protein
MFHRATNPMALRDFRASVQGEVILPHDDGYDSARRVWNGMIDYYPALIIRCANRADFRIRARDPAIWAGDHDRDRCWDRALGPHPGRWTGLVDGEIRLDH